MAVFRDRVKKVYGFSVSLLKCCNIAPPPVSFSTDVDVPHDTTTFRETKQIDYFLGLKRVWIFLIILIGSESASILFSNCHFQRDLV
ncbi:hypothetical protein HanRHA438_Chr09g0393321 [Helianthus annuus]|nr:hypothetical protein HanRHA438_Chr09g0393321 [Helianthus annuus]